jgi:hypothetical protein
MCEFKYCRGTGNCFLSKTSPCADLKSKEDETQNEDRVNSVRVSYPGFLNPNELFDILDLADEASMATPKRKRGAFGPAPRFLGKAQEAV